MMISQQLLHELKEIIREDYGKDLEMAQISQIGNALVGYFDTLAKIHHKNTYENTTISE